ncbi:unnamed protein product [Clavelina lepadiformis]|uniref:Eukaryotic translation initiation factor 5B n=1 Tax=Clavelina lepadiformis TaxID=159417 RepID=A0ABP0H1P7_CLALP
MGKKKDKQKSSANVAQAQLDDQSFDNDAQPSKAQTKKGRKKLEDNWEDDVLTELAVIAGDKIPVEDKANDGPGTKLCGKKSKKKFEDNWEDDVANEIAVLSGDKPMEEDAARDTSTAKPHGKKGKKKVEDNWEDDVANEISVLSGKKPVDEAMEGSASAKQQPKKGKKKAKKDDNWEDDVLNEIAVLSGDKAADETTAKEEHVSKSKKQKNKKKSEQQAKKLDSENKETEGKDDIPRSDTGTPADGLEQTEATMSNKQKKKKKAEEAKAKKEEKGKKGKLNKTALKAMKEALAKQKEEEERLRQEQEEKIRKEEEERQKQLQALEIERQKKEKKKQDKKDRIKRLKEEGKYLNPSQIAAKKKREAYLESLKQAGIAIPDKSEVGEKPKKPKYEKKKKQVKKDDEEKPEVASLVVEEEPMVEEETKEEIQVATEETAQDNGDVEEDDLDHWEDMANETQEGEKQSKRDADNGLSEFEDEDVEEEESSDDSEESEESEVEEELTQREKTLKRMKQLREQNEMNRSTDNLRSPVICVMGHVDTGKTKILDKIRHSHVQDGEAGGITQQIGATNIPVTAIQEQTKMVDDFKKILIPGLLVIDTPGHESFSNLRSRGSSNCDMAILVVDIMHGLEPQTVESINMLRKRKTPFIVALNKIDRLYEWKASPDRDVVATIKQQKKFTKDEFQEKVNHVIVQFAEQGLNAKLHYENDDLDTWISMVPTSAHSGDGMGNLIALVVQSCQTRLAKRLSYSENLQCTVLEVKAIQGLGTTVDVILTNGRLKYGNTIVLAGVEGPIVTHVKGLLMPQPLKELRVKNPYDKFNEIKAAQGVKILAKDLDKALAGTSLLVAKRDDEIEILKDDVQAEVAQALKSIKLQERGVYVQASTLGSLEALLEFLKQSKIPYSGISIGPVHKRDVMKASVMLEHDDQWAVILAFDVKVEREAQEIAENLGVRIFTADIIYHLFDAFMQHREDLKKRKQDEFRHLAVFPCKFRIVPNCVFKSRDPIVVGVNVEAGQLRIGTPICVPSKDFLNVGIVGSMEFNHKSVEVARKSQEVCIKIENAPGEAPKMVGRHFDETDLLTSKISRDSINLLKDWFREEMQKSDWQVIIELKKLFDII